MKKVLLFLLITLAVFKVSALEVTPNATRAILIDPDSKKILYEKNIHEEASIASLTKMMGLILIFEEIDSGKIKYTDKVIASSNAANMGGSQIWLSPGEELTVDELLKGIIMASANDGIVAMAEYIGGSEENFVKMMNNKARELNLMHTNFVNPTGLDEEGHYSSAYDLAIIASELMKHKDVFKYTTLYEDYLRKNTDNKFWLVNTNKLLKSYKGVDGLKTGMTDKAGYCMAITAKRDNMRILAIVLGEKEGKVRNKETSDLLDYGFNNYEVITIKKKGDKVGSITLDKSIPKEIDVALEEDITIIKRKGESKKDYKSIVKLNDLKLPIKKGDIIGKLLIKDNNVILKEIALKSNKDMQKQSFFNLLLNTVKSMLTGDIV